MTKRGAEEVSDSLPPVPKRSLLEFLTPPKKLSPVERLGIKVYTEAEIEGEQESMTRSYRRFWNEKANDFCCNPETLRRLGCKRAIQGAITLCWVRSDALAS